MRGINANLPRLRAAYQEIWNRPWPFEDSYLRELAYTADSREEVLMLMRECHEFEPEPTS